MQLSTRAPRVAARPTALSKAIQRPRTVVLRASASAAEQEQVHAKLQGLKVGALICSESYQGTSCTLLRVAGEPNCMLPCRSSQPLMAAKSTSWSSGAPTTEH